MNFGSQCQCHALIVLRSQVGSTPILCCPNYDTHSTTSAHTQLSSLPHHREAQQPT